MCVDHFGRAVSVHIAQEWGITVADCRTYALGRYIRVNPCPIISSTQVNGSHLATADDAPRQEENVWSENLADSFDGYKCPLFCIDLSGTSRNSSRSTAANGKAGLPGSAIVLAKHAQPRGSMHAL